MTGHVPAALLDRYARGGAAIGADTLWAVEAHLETCATCRQRLSVAIAPDTAALLSRVRGELSRQVDRGTQMPVRRRWPRRAVWASPALLPWVGMTVLVVLAALGLDLVDQGAGDAYPSLVVLLAPVAPLFGVAAAWSGRLDPAYELVVAGPRAGLHLVLRRTLAVLVVVIPTLAGAGWVVGASPARWLLPSLAFTAGALALGEVIGLRRAALGLAVVWVAVAVAPSLVTARPPVLLAPATMPLWAGSAAAVALVAALGRNGYTNLPSSR